MSMEELDPNAHDMALNNLMVRLRVIAHDKIQSMGQIEFSWHLNWLKTDNLS